MRKLLWFLIIVGFLILIWFVVNSSNISPITPNTLITPTPSVFIFAKVIRAIDGDTIIIDTGQKVRYIGMNTPELQTSECFATEAAEINKNLVLGKNVKLEKDISETDKYGRLLRYVYLDNEMINDELVKEGTARIETVPPDIKYKSEFFTSEKYARENDLGLWNRCRN